MPVTEDEQRQLSQTREELVREFADRLSEQDVSARFAEVLSAYESAPVRSFVPVLAAREARAVLREAAPRT